jgi:site-specific recombinase XerD
MEQEQTRNNESSTINKLDRGMTLQEVQLLLTAPMGDRERAFFRAIYDTFYRANEMLQCNIEDYNRNTGELTCLKPKAHYDRTSGKVFQPQPKHMILSLPTQMLFKSIISNRKKGAIFINRQGTRCSITYFQMYINDLATKLGIQKITHITPLRKEYHLVTLQALREAGERHTDLAGADKDVTARGAQHSAIIKEKYYKKSGWEEVQSQVKKYHPSFRE